MAKITEQLTELISEFTQIERDNAKLNEDIQTLEQEKADGYKKFNTATHILIGRKTLENIKGQLEDAKYEADSAEDEASQAYSSAEQASSNASYACDNIRQALSDVEEILEPEEETTEAK